VHADPDPVSGQPDLKGTGVRVSALTETWRGVLLRLTGGEPELSDRVWWAKAQINTGFAFELSGWSPLTQEVHSEVVLRRLLRISVDAELVSYSDPRRAMFRYAGLVQGRLAACVFFAAAGTDFMGADQAKALLGKEISAAERMALLAGLNATNGQTGKTVCACFCVSEQDIRDAIQRHGLRTPAAIGAALKAGTNCGSCIPELKKLLGATPSPVI
jgi:assimilatory nitrate reductase catalytic subunit